MSVIKEITVVSLRVIFIQQAPILQPLNFSSNLLNTNLAKDLELYCLFDMFQNNDALHEYLVFTVGSTGLFCQF